MSARWLALLLGAFGVALVVKGFMVGPPPFGIEGAYFTRESGTPAYSGVFTGWSVGLASTEDGALWLGAGAAAIAITLAALVRPRLLGLHLLLVAAALLVVAIAVGPPTYLTWYAVAARWHGLEPMMVGPGDGNLWLGAACALTVAALSSWALQRITASRTHDAAT